MSLKVSVQKQINAAFKAMGDLVKNAVYKECTEISRVDYTSVPVFEETNVKCIVTSYKRHEIEWSAGAIIVTDKKVLIPREGLEIEIRTSQRLVIDEIEHDIINVVTDPTSSLYTVQARA